MLPTTRPFRVAYLLAPVALLAALAAGCLKPEFGSAPRAAEKDYLFCFWNVENFFDDKDDNRKTTPDREFDNWFSHDREALRLKLDRLSSALLKMNDGKGPDILALAEVESERAAELLMDALNKNLKDDDKYRHILFKEVHGGRSINTAILTRLDVQRDRTRTLGNRQRILEGHLRANGHELIVVASHWTSRVSDTEGDRRDKYADTIYGRFKAIFKDNPRVAFLVCGDFNDPPDDESVTEHLHAIGNERKVRASADRDEPLLYDLFAGPDYVDGKKGSHYYRGKWLTFDQIAVSPGMLDQGTWTCETETARIVNDLTADRKGRPLRFGTEKEKGERGWSDHFPVTVRLKVAPSSE